MTTHPHFQQRMEHYQKIANESETLRQIRQTPNKETIGSQLFKKLFHRIVSRKKMLDINSNVTSQPRAVKQD